MDFQATMSPGPRQNLTSWLSLGPVWECRMFVRLPENSGSFVFGDGLSIGFSMSQ